MLSIKGVSKSYTIEKESIPILKDINLTIGQGEFCTIVGPSGCGKTTLLNLIAGLDRVSGGTIDFNHTSIEKRNDRQWSEWRRCEVGYIFQNFNLIEFMTAEQNVEIVLQANGFGKSERKSKAKELLQKVGLSGRGKHLPSQLSGGQKQRVAIARALANQPHILLADEPTGAMDSVSSQEIMDLLKRLNKEDNVTVIMVTHDDRLANQADRTIRMLDGRIISDQSSGKVTEEKDIIANNSRRKGLPFTEFFIAMKNMTTKKKRTLLTSFGTSIGIAGVLLVCGIGSGAKNRIMQEFSLLVNSHNVNVQETNDAKMSDEFIKEILLDERVLDLYPNNMADAFCSYGDKVGKGIVQSIGPVNNCFEYWESNLMYGEMPSSDEAAEAIITLTLAETLMGEGQGQSILGCEIDMAFLAGSETGLSDMAVRKVKVTGIAGKAFMGMTEMIYVPYLLSEQVVRESMKDPDHRSVNYCITVKNENSTTDIKDWMLEKKFKSTTDVESLGTIGTIIDLVTAVIVLLAGISLVVSGIMIALVTYMGVTERTREIGILRAVGFSSKNVKKIFLTEGGMVGFLAGILGVLFSTVFGGLVNLIIKAAFPEIVFKLYQVGLFQVLFCIVFSIVIGLICSHSPARKAAKMEPVKALGYVQ